MLEIEMNFNFRFIALNTKKDFIKLSLGKSKKLINIIILNNDFLYGSYCILVFSDIPIHLI